ncbi:peptide chain release factor 2 [bacterium]|nr:peptide chain release factor 2 [bacterium]
MENQFDLENLEKRLLKLRGYLDVDALLNQIQGLDSKMSEPNFWQDSETSQRVARERKTKMEQLSTWKHLNQSLQDLKELQGIIRPEDPEYDQLLSELRAFEGELEAAELFFYLSGPDDQNSAVLEIHSGAGGTDACDWGEMLLRMYLRWAEQSGFQTKIIDIQAGDEAGIKSATVEVLGEYAYGYLKSEIGVHRLVRLSPFDSNHRRHTSFASVFVFPMKENDIEIEIDPNDLRIDTFRASGHGGQHINVTDSAIRITHLPTGLVVQCQSERSQHQNKQTAMTVLKSRLFQLRKEELEKSKQEQEKTKKKIEWGSQIRSYVIHPYNMVKDHRTDKQIGDTQAVLDGYITPFIHSFLTQNE